MFEIAVICLVITAFCAYANDRYIGIPTTIGVMAIAMLLSMALILAGKLGYAAPVRNVVMFVKSIDFSAVLMNGMLSVLLFAGSLQIDVGGLRARRWAVIVLALGGTLVSTIIVGLLTYMTLPLLGLSMPFWFCMVFGALISPTDPIAVLAVMRQTGAPRRLDVIIAGESLFNDGVGVVLFALMLDLALQRQALSVTDGLTLALQEVGGGLLLGLVVGLLLYQMLCSIDNYSVEVLLTLAAVLGGYLLAEKLHVSGPLAMVVAGLLIGKHGREKAMSEATRHHVDLFWGLMDEILNAVLFVLLGLELLVVKESPIVFAAGLAAILITLLARLVSVGIPASILSPNLGLPAGTWKLLTWGGLRGGISVALALSLRAGQERDLILALTYPVVAFALLVQGLTVKRVVQHLVANDDSDARSASMQL